MLCSLVRGESTRRIYLEVLQYSLGRQCPWRVHLSVLRIL
jgi:hypothetical protein